MVMEKPILTVTMDIQMEITKMESVFIRMKICKLSLGLILIQFKLLQFDTAGILGRINSITLNLIGLLD